MTTAARTAAPPCCERYQNHGLLTRIDWPLGGGQLAAYNHALRFFGRAARWLAYYDVDEYLVPLLDDDIPSFLARFPDVAVVRVPRLEFGYSGHRSPPPGLAIDEYTQVANVLDLDADLPPRVKSIVRPEAISAVDIHLAFPADVPAPGVPTGTAEEAVRGVAQLNHYYTRSFEEFEAKRYRGSATGRIERPAVPFDLPTIETSTAAQRFSARTRDEMARLRSLEQRPYMYGSQLRLEWFPRPNDLGRFAEFALANLAAGLPEPARSAASRLRNLHEGVGLAADLAAAGYGPVPAGLSSSAHLAVLVEHMRGRLETTLTAPGADGGGRGRDRQADAGRGRHGQPRTAGRHRRALAGPSAARHAALLVGRLPHRLCRAAPPGADRRAPRRRHERARAPGPAGLGRAGRGRRGRARALPGRPPAGAPQQRGASAWRSSTSSPSPTAEVLPWA